MSSLLSFCRDEAGQDLVEYSLLLAFIAIAAVALLRSFGTLLNNMGANTLASMFSAYVSSS